MKRKLSGAVALTSVAAILAMQVESSACGDHKSGNSIVDIAVGNENFSTLVAALKTAELVEALSGDGPFTVFAPTNDAFAKLPEGTVESLLKPENRQQLVDILKYHVVAGKVLAADAIAAKRADTLLGKPIGMTLEGGQLTINDSKVVANDVEATNGVIHVIDTVLLPPATKKASASNSGMDIITAAIDRGVPLFNAGQHDACTAVYEMAAMSLVRFDGDLIGDGRERLVSAMSKASRTHDSGERAWIMRRALDDVFAMYESSM